MFWNVFRNIEILKKIFHFFTHKSNPMSAPDFKSDDYYKILGVAKSAEQDVIKKAVRSMSLYISRALEN